MEKKKFEQKRMTPDEREMFCLVGALNTIFGCKGDRLKELCERVGKAEKIDEVAKTIDELLIGIADTIPTDQLYKIVQQMKLTDIHVGLKKPTGKPKDYWVISYEDAAALADYATRTECIACDGNKHKCPLREVLKDLPIMGITNYYVACWKEEE